MDNMGSTFGMPRGSACGLVHLYAGLLKQGLEKLGVMPKRHWEKKWFTVKNTVMTTLKRWILFLGLTTQGSVHDYELLKEEPGWYNGKTGWFELLEIFVDLGCLGIEKDFEAKGLNIPAKRPRKAKDNPAPKLTEAQKERNKAVSRARVLVEHAIGSMKFFKNLREDYRNRRDGFDDLPIEIWAGLHNLYIKRKLN